MILNSFFFFFFFYRNDISGALTTILENAPYGPSVDEAKVCTPLCAIKHKHLLILLKAYHPPNPPHDLKHHQISRNLRSHQRSLVRHSRYAHEIPLQGDGYTWVGRH